MSEMRRMLREAVSSPANRRRRSGRGLRVALAGLAAAIVMAAVPSVASAQAWQCDAFGYLFQSPNPVNGFDPPHEIIQVDLATGQQRKILDTDWAINAVGFNVLDGYFYGSQQRQLAPGDRSGVPSLVRVHSDGSVDDLGLPAGLADPSAIGDVDANGHYWMINGDGRGGYIWYEIDLMATPRPTVVRTANVAVPAGVTNIGADWTFINGSLYSIGGDAAGNFYLVRFDTATGRFASAQRLNRIPVTPPGSGSGFGATFTDASGYLYASRNSSGQIYRVDPRTLATIQPSTGQRTAGNDGARCAAAPVPTITLRKAVDGRVRAADQFTVGLVEDTGRELDSATTSGAGTSATTTNWPVSQGRTYAITDTMAAGSASPISEYDKSIACVDEAGNPAPTGGSPGNWTLLVANPAFYTCTVTNRASADLVMEKTASPSPVVPGSDVTYTLRVTNRGPSTALGASVSDPLGRALTFVSASQGCTFANGTVTCAAGDLASGASRTFTVTARIDPAVTSCSAASGLENTATATSAIFDPNTGNNRATVCPPPDPRANVTIEKTASDAVAVPGRNTTFTLRVTNNGPSTARAVRAVDPLPRGLTFVSAGEGCTFAAGTVTCAAGDMAPGASRTFRVTARVRSSATSCENLRNTARVISATPDPDTSDNTDSACPTLRGEADLSITKTPSVDRVGVGQQLFYTLVIRNDGPSDAQDVSVHDTAGAGLTLLEARGSQGVSCSVAASRVTCRVGTLAAGGTAQVLVSARADRAGELTNTATVDSATPDPDPRNNRDDRRVTGDPAPPTPVQPADLEIVKTSNRRAVLGMQAITYTLRVRNLGPGDVSGVQVIDTPSLPVSVVSVRPSVGRCTTSAPIRCDLGTLRVGAGATVRVTARPMAPGTLRNSASVTGDVPDPRAENNIDGTTTRVLGLLRIRKTASTTRIRAGGTLSYRITVTNASLFALRSVRVCDNPPSGLVLVSSTPKARLSRGRHCWTIRALGARKSKTFTVRARALRGSSGRKVNTATATAPGARGARSRAAADSAPIQVIAGQVRSGGVTG